MQNIMHNTLVVLLLLANSILYTPSSSTFIVVRIIILVFTYRRDLSFSRTNPPCPANVHLDTAETELAPLSFGPMSE